jgi:hypothetical protein
MENMEDLLEVEFPVPAAAFIYNSILFEADENGGAGGVGG